MKRIYFILFSMCFSCATMAQEDVVLDEVTITASRVQRTGEGLRIFPSAEQIESAGSSWGLLQRLNLPQLTVNEAMRTISGPPNLGAVQIRINDVKASEQDLLALQLADVQSIDYIRRPGLRYGEGVDFVVNFRVRRPDSGYVVGGSAYHSVNKIRHSDNVFAKWNRGRQEVSFGCDFGYANSKGPQGEDLTTYRLADGNSVDVVRKDLDSWAPSLANAISLKYSLADGERYVFQTTLSGDFTQTKDGGREAEESCAGRSERTESRYTSRSLSPTLDVYFSLNLPRSQSLVADVSATHIASDYDYRYRAAKPYAYAIDGATWAVGGEAVYEKRFAADSARAVSVRDFSAGTKFRQQWADNLYSGDLSVDDRMRYTDNYFFAQLRGRIAERLNWRAGASLTHRHERQGGQAHTDWFLRPILSLDYFPTRWLSVSYSFEQSQKPVRLVWLNNTKTRDRSVLTPQGRIEEYTVGNPSLRPVARTEHTLTASATWPRVQSYLMALYRINCRTDMQHIERQTLADGKTEFLHSHRQSDGGEINMLYLYNQSRFTLIRDRLTLALSGSFIRSMNLCDEYRRFRSAFMFGADLTAYLGRFTLAAHFDDGYRTLEGETKINQGAAIYYSVGYRLGSWGSLTLFHQHPFQKNVLTAESWTDNPAYQKHAVTRSQFNANMLGLRLSVNLSRGRTFRKIEKRLNASDIETGIVTKK